MVVNLLMPFVFWALAMPTNPWLVLLSFLNFVFAAVLWSWKKVGCYGLGASFGIMFFLGLLFGDLLSAVGAVISFFLLSLLVAPKWHLFD
jgi:hypothetical protein